ncbi:MAG: DUF3095 family protein [Bdellovibrionales bacterium]|nr:DUF3095 family protein [Bdellovibrionales bacterium]
MQRNFYNDLKPIRNYRDLTNPEVYQKIPDNWVVFIADIVGSTVAIEKGRYKDVNTLGAACVSCVQEALKGIEFPFVFGGDGASLVVPQEFEATAASALALLQNLAQTQFALQLRVGKVSMAQIEERGYSVEVAKLSLNEKKTVALFKGGGLAAADQWIKAAPKTYQVVAKDGKVELTGLSCRWQPIQNHKGKILTIIVQAKDAQSDWVYQKVIDRLSIILGGNISNGNPVDGHTMAYKTFWSCLRDEWRYFTPHWGWNLISRVVEVLMSVAIFKFRSPTYGELNRIHYVKSLKTHSDYCKFDDCLRLVVDCSLEQQAAISQFLEDLYKTDLVRFGLHESDEALMTCYVSHTGDGGHIHFIDGGDGGYAMAAKQLKDQIQLESPAKKVS